MEFLLFFFFKYSHEIDWDSYILICHDIFFTEKALITFSWILIQTEIFFSEIVNRSNNDMNNNKKDMKLIFKELMIQCQNKMRKWRKNEINVMTGQQERRGGKRTGGRRNVPVGEMTGQTCGQWDRKVKLRHVLCLWLYLRLGTHLWVLAESE